MWTGLIKQLGMNMHVSTLVLLEDFESMWTGLIKHTQL